MKLLQGNGKVRFECGCGKSVCANDPRYKSDNNLYCLSCGRAKNLAIRFNTWLTSHTNVNDKVLVKA